VILKVINMEVDQAGGEVPALVPVDAANNNTVVIKPLGSVVAGTGTAGSVTVSLHPLVIMNISEHWTRVRAQNDGKAEQGND